jgi:hypothetical protein
MLSLFTKRAGLFNKVIGKHSKVIMKGIIKSYRIFNRNYNQRKFLYEEKSYKMTYFNDICQQYSMIMSAVTTRRFPL